MRRAVALLLLLSLLFTLAFSISGAAAEPEVCFLALNETVLDLSTTPYFYGSAFVPYTVFSSFRIYSSFFSSSNTVCLYHSNKQLYFNLNTGQAFDGDDNYYSTSTVTKNGQIYVSVPFVCSFFGLSWSYIKGVGYGDILRITDSDSYLSDSDFIYAAANIMQPRYESYINSLTPPSPSAPAETVVPTQDSHVNTPVYLSFEGLPSSALLDMLSRYSVHAAFYLKPEEIASAPDTVRRICGSGHSVGIYCGVDAAGDYSAGAALLLDAAQIATVMVSSSGDGLAACTALAAETNLKMNTFDIDAADRYGYGVSSALVNTRIDNANRSVHVRFDCSSSTERALSAILSHLSTNQYSLRLEREV